MPFPQVVAVVPSSPAGLAGIAPGDEIRSLNGVAPRDVIEYRLIVDEPSVEFEIVRGGLSHEIVVEKRAGEPIGIEVSSAVFDRVRTCDNHCAFCFIYQLPKGMRKSLYMKDDDYRLSFLYGNFTTLTRFTELDLARVVEDRLSPLYVSIHATDPDVRSAMLRNRRGATSLRWLRALLDHGIDVHGQVVVCPGVNDGAVLVDTLFGVLERFPELCSVGVVPLGVSRHSHEATMRPHTRDEAASVLEIITEFQAHAHECIGRDLVYASDEYYLAACRPFPALEDYGDLVQHENGIGMSRLFIENFLGRSTSAEARRGGFFASVDGAPAAGYRAPRAGAATTPAASAGPTSILTGEYGAAVLVPLLEEAGCDAEVVCVENRYFGGNIAVAGLLTGADLSDTLCAADPRRRYLLPDVCLSEGRFLDGMTPDDLPVRVEVVEATGNALAATLRAAEGQP